MKKAMIPLFMLLGIGFGAYGQNANVDKAVLRSEMGLMKMFGEIPFHFNSALDGKPLSQAKVVIPRVGAFVTDSRGLIKFPAPPDGSYTLTVSKDGFISTPIDFRVMVGGVVVYDWFSISPILYGDFRMVLNWGERPADLDLHFEKQGGYHISYWNMKTVADGSAKLDRDDTSGFGPETITVSKAESNSSYSLYVVDYTNQGKAGSTALGASNGVVRIYHNNQLVNTFTVPQGRGTRWNICNIVQNAVVPVNTITN